MIRMRKLIIFLFFSCLFHVTVGQPANYELAEKSKSNRLADKSMWFIPVFVPGSDNFWFRTETNEVEKYYFVDVKAKKVEDLFDVEYIASEMAKVTGKIYHSKKLGFWGTPFKEDGVTLSWEDGRYHFEYNRKTQKLTHVEIERSSNRDERGIPPEIERMMRQKPGVSPDGKYQVFGRKCNIYLRDLQDSTEVQLTFDGERGFSYAQERDDAEEVGVIPVWAADSKRFYHYRHDNRGVAGVFNMDYLQGRPRAYPSPVVLAGDTGVVHLEVSVFDVNAKKQTKVKIEKWKDQMARILHVDENIENFYMERKKRTCDVLEICQVDVKSGDVKVLIQEECEPYIGIELSSIHFLNQGDDMIMWSERTGYGHLYHYDGEGNLKNAITSGEWSVGQVVKIDTLKQEIYFQAYGFTKGENPSYAKICKARWDGKGKVVLLTPEEATHSVQFTPSGRYFIDTYSRPDQPHRFALRDVQGKLIVNLAEMDIQELYDKGWQMPGIFSVKAADGVTDLYGVMWKPFDFDSTKNYPIISCVYPGPQTDNVPLTFEINSTNEILAQVGFIVVAFNHRGGVPYRGSAYHTFGHGNIRDYALADDKSGLEQLVARHSFIDGERIGVYGHSGGGFMSTTAICTYPEFYKAAVSSAGNHDNNIYSQFFVETHFGVKEVVKSVKKRVKTIDGRDSLITREEQSFEVKVPTNMELAKNLKGHLMLVVGGRDGNVHPANTIRMVDALVGCGKDVELVFLPQASHVYDGVSDWYFQHKLWSHFGKYLLGDFTTPCFYDVDSSDGYSVKRVL